jgi:hypothetical protein
VSQSQQNRVKVRIAIVDVHGENNFFFFLTFDLEERKKYLGIQVVAIAVGEPQESVVAVRQGVGADPGDVVPLFALPSTVATCHDARNLSGRTQVVLDPLIR